MTKEHFDINQNKSIDNETVYITESTAKSSLRNIDLQKFGNYPCDDLYHTNLDYILSSREREWLSAAKLLYEDTGFFIEYAYSKLKKPKDSLKWIYPEKNKSYHLFRDCKHLSLDYENFEIPAEIVGRGEDEVNKFREFFLKNKNLYETNPKRFAIRIENNFGLISNINALKKIEIQNSGIQLIETENLATLEEKIDKEIADLIQEKQKDDEAGKTIRKYGFRYPYKEVADKEESNILETWEKKNPI